MDRARIERTLRDYFRGARPDLTAAYLFGSVARGDAGARSDVDVGLVLAAGEPRSLDEYPFAIQWELEKRLGAPVDLVVMNAAPVDLVHRILRDGFVVWENDRTARIEFEILARNEYFDLAPILDRYRKTVMRSV